MTESGRGLPSVHLRLLALPYAVIPASMVVVALDLMQGAHLRDTLPATPQALIFFSLFFELPHIVASNLIFASTSEYRRVFRRQAMVSLVAGVLFAVGMHRGWLYGFFTFAFAVWTVVHVVRQQLGLALAFARAPRRRAQLFQALGLGASIPTYLLTYNSKQLPAAWTIPILCLAAAGTLAFVVVAVTIARGAPGRDSANYVLFNAAMVVAALIFTALDYRFFVILGPRVIHDVTAFVFYAAHERGRHGTAPDSGLYRTARTFHIPTLAVLPVLAIAIAYFLNWGAADLVRWAALDPTNMGRALGALVGLRTLLGVMHYTLEASTWKSASPYRRYFQMVRG